MSKDKAPNKSMRHRLGGFFGRKSPRDSNQKTESNGTSSLSIDYCLFNVEAAEWALRNAGATYDNITEEEKEAIRQAVATFVRERGFTVGKVTQLLSKHFEKERAEVIARTEITRAYAMQRKSRERRRCASSEM